MPRAPQPSPGTHLSTLRPPSTVPVRSRGRARVILAVALALGAALGGAFWVGLWGGAEAPAPPERALDDLAQTEPLAADVEGRLLNDFVGPLAAGERAAPLALLAPGFCGRLDDVAAPPARRDERGELSQTDLTPGGARLDRERFCERLLDLVAGFDRYGRLGADIERFEVDAADPRRVYAHARLRWAGWRSVADEQRVDVRLVLALALEREDGALQVRFAELLTGQVLEGVPRFRDVARETGFTFAESRRNRDLGQAFVDQHRTLALGGLSVVDFDRDGLPDVLAARAGELSLLFQNDGRGGFLPRPLPPASADEHPAFFLFVDLDGDGREELVGSRPTGYEGDRAYVGLWTRPDGGDAWVHHPRAFALPNPVGLRRLAVQTVVPFDMDRDGDLDLFFAVYGSAASRGEHYNTVDATDGADNHLCENEGGLRFREVSAERGLSGTRYTYVATAFDFDGDGHLDLFEGNDFGPNVLWRNDGRGHFRADTELGFDGVPAYTMGATLADFDNSGRWSLYISNMSSAEGMRMVPIAPGVGEPMRRTLATIARGNMLYTQRGPGEAWEERGVALGVHDCGWAWGPTFFDADNDGDRDLFVTNGFTSHRDRTRPDFQTQYWRQVIADGRALERGERAPNTLVRATPTSFNGYENDRLFVNLGAGALPDAAFVLGVDADHDGRAVVPLDFDGDGDLDLALWALDGLCLYENCGPARAFVRLALEDPASPHPPLGAVAELRAGGQRQRELVRIVDGFQTQISTELHFGLGAATIVDEVTVTWPDGARETWRDLAVDRHHTLVRGSSEARTRALPRWPAHLAPAGGEPRVNALLPGALGGFDTPHAAGRPLLLRVARTGHMAWPTAEALVAAPTNLRVARVLADGIWEGTPALRRSEADLGASGPWLREGFGATFERGETTAVKALTVVTDAEGQLVRTFRFEPTAEELALVLQLAADEPAFPALLVEHGRQALEEHRYREALALFQEALAGFDGDPSAWEGFGRAHVLLGRVDLAEDAYAASVRVDPDYGIGHYNLGVTRAHLGRPAEALAPLREALRIEGPLRRNLLALGEAAAVAGEDELALETYTELAARHPEEVAAHVALGKLYARRGVYAEAAAALRRALALEPDHADARAALRKVEALSGAAPNPR